MYFVFPVAEESNKKTRISASNLLKELFEKAENLKMQQQQQQPPKIVITSFLPSSSSSSFNRSSQAMTNAKEALVRQCNDEEMLPSYEELINEALSFDMINPPIIVTSPSEVMSEQNHTINNINNNNINNNNNNNNMDEMSQLKNTLESMKLSRADSSIYTGYTQARATETETAEQKIADGEPVLNDSNNHSNNSTAIIIAQTESTTNNANLNEEFSSSLPWMPDSCVTHCHICDKKFGFWIRKHHCRYCGWIICGSCSEWRIKSLRAW